MASNSSATRTPFADVGGVKSKEFDFAHDISDQILRFKSISPLPILLSLSIQFRKDGQLLSLAICDTNTMLVLIHDVENKPTRSSVTVENIHPSILLLFQDPDVLFTGFHFHRIALLLKAQLVIDLQGYDIISSMQNLGPVSTPGQVATRFLSPKEFPQFEVDALWDDTVVDLPHATTRGIVNLVDRAWITAKVTSTIQQPLMESDLLQTTRITTKTWLLRNYIWEMELLDSAKPNTRQSEVKSFEQSKNGDNFVVNNARYKTKLRNDMKTRVIVTDMSGKQHAGRTSGAEGKKTYFKTATALRVEDIRSVHSEGRESKKSAEYASDTFALRVLRGQESLDKSPFINAIWLMFKAQKVKKRMREAIVEERLNLSQAEVVRAMTDSPDELIVLVHGPPGTGKTSTISKATARWLSIKPKKGTWIVAQSNVGVKNVAESLAKDNIKFRLLVSAEFYVEWHEHLYPGVEEELIRTDELPEDMVQLNKLFDGIRVVLCTLSSLSNPMVRQSVYSERVPIHHLIVDEASQISVFQYLHLFAQLRKLEKVCFFGDPKQLPPYGQDAAPSLRSIFDIKHLREKAYLLNIQYRMPVPLGNFISEFVYRNRLESNHRVTDPSCVAFIDVSKGEERRQGSSFVNEREVHTIVQLVRKYYQHRNSCIITPYDAQRNFLQKSLEAEGLPFETVYNVDSFQGNEAEYIILSTVRTQRPGFLKSQNRVNVMLTRSKQRLIIVTNKEFIRSRSMRETLLGKMCIYWEDEFGEEFTWWDAQEVLNPPASAIVRISSSSSVSTTNTVISMEESDGDDPRTMIAAGSVEDPIELSSDDENDRAATKPIGSSENPIIFLPDDDDSKEDGPTQKTLNTQDDVETLTDAVSGLMIGQGLNCNSTETPVNSEMPDEVEAVVPCHA